MVLSVGDGTYARVMAHACAHMTAVRTAKRYQISAMVLLIWPTAWSYDATVAWRTKVTCTIVFLMKNIKKIGIQPAHNCTSFLRCTAGMKKRPANIGAHH